MSTNTRIVNRFQSYYLEDCDCRCWITKRVVDEAKEFPDKTPEELTFPKENDIIDSGGESVNIDVTDASGAIPRDDTSLMDDHAKRYYEEICKRNSDIESIEKNTGFSRNDFIYAKDENGGFFISNLNLIPDSETKQK